MLQLLARCRLHRGTDDAAAFCNGGRRGAGGRGVGGGCRLSDEFSLEERTGVCLRRLLKFTHEPSSGKREDPAFGNRISLLGYRDGGVCLLEAMDGWALCLRLRGGAGGVTTHCVNNDRVSCPLSLSSSWSSRPSILESKGYPSQLGKPIRF